MTEYKCCMICIASVNAPVELQVKTTKKWLGWIMQNSLSA